MSTKGYLSPHEVLVKASVLTTPGDTSDAKLQAQIMNDATSPVPVEVLNGSAGVSINQTGEQLLVASGVETTISFYTVPVGKIFYLERIEYDGTVISEYKIKINGIKIAQRRTYWSVGFSDQFDFRLIQSPGLSATAGQVVSITAIHNTGAPGDYFARIQGSLKDV